jgi:flagellar biosynthesis protein FlhB
VVAKGYGQLAERIIDRAKDAGVFVHDSPELVSLLMQVIWTGIFRKNSTAQWQKFWPSFISWKTRRPVPISSLNPG